MGEEGKRRKTEAGADRQVDTSLGPGKATEVSAPWLVVYQMAEMMTALTSRACVGVQEPVYAKCLQQFLATGNTVYASLLKMRHLLCTSFQTLAFTKKEIFFLLLGKGVYSPVSMPYIYIYMGGWA